MTHKEIAEWMVRKLEQEKSLYQDVVVDEIASKFGHEFTYERDSGGLAIDKKVLNEFRSITKENVVWERGGKYWRFRESEDTKGKRQAD